MHFSAFGRDCHSLASSVLLNFVQIAQFDSICHHVRLSTGAIRISYAKHESETNTCDNREIRFQATKRV